MNATVSASALRGRALPWTTTLGLLVLAGTAAADSGRRAGDVLSLALPLATLGTEWWRGDTEGMRQYAWTFGLTTGSAELLKRSTKVTRPDGSNDLSFPSGHAARAFSAAAYVRQRHGLMPSVPLYAAALYVGHTRVDARRHRWADVLGAAALAEVSAHWLVTPKGDAGRSLALGWDGEGLTATFSARW